MAQDYQKTQQSIIRQSQIKNLIEYCRLIGTPLKMHEIIKMTNVLVDYCENGYQYVDNEGKTMKDRLKAMDDHIAKKFEERL